MTLSNKPLEELQALRDEVEREIAEACYTWLGLGDKFRTPATLIALMLNVLEDKAPLAPAEPVDVEALAREVAIEVYRKRDGNDAIRDISAGNGAPWAAYQAAETAVRATLARCARWPTDAELEMLALGSAWPDRTPEETALEMARRLRAYQTGAAS